MIAGPILTPDLATWATAALATLGVILRPFSWPEAIWLGRLGAGLLVALRLLPWQTALSGVGKGTDVYLFLVGRCCSPRSRGRRGCSTGSPCTRPGARPRTCSSVSTASGRW